VTPSILRNFIISHGLRRHGKLKIKYATYMMPCRPGRSSLEIGGWTGTHREMVDGSITAVALLPFVEGRPMASRLSISSNACDVVNDNGNVRFDGISRKSRAAFLTGSEFLLFSPVGPPNTISSTRAMDLQTPPGYALRHRAAPALFTTIPGRFRCR